jgi:lipoprotein-anchoring transpeptidase ErfK/SrfK
MKASLRCCVVCAAAVVLSGCAGLEMRDPKSRQAARYRQQHEAFRAQEGWRKLTYRQTDLLAQATAKNTAVEISLTDQRGLLLVHGAVAMDFPVATGKASHPTPPGTYKILEKKKDHASNLYGRILSATGETLDSDADTRTDTVPEGGSFVGAPMPYWMRMTPTGVGMHVGYVPGRPASHGCIRLKKDAAAQLFSILELGSPVTVAEQRSSG